MRCVGRDRRVDARARGGHVTERHRVVSRVSSGQKRAGLIGSRVTAADQRLGRYPVQIEGGGKVVGRLRIAVGEGPVGNGIHGLMLRTAPDGAAPRQA